MILCDGTCSENEVPFDFDNDGDGVPNCRDTCPNDPAKTSP